MLGVFHPREALKMAEEKGLDLLEIAPGSNPPTCKIMDFGKWKYEAKKKAHQARKNQTIIVVKEIQIRPRTDQHDLDTKLRHARRFILEGDKVKISLRFLGREMAHQEFGRNVVDGFVKALEDICVVETPLKSEGKQLFVILSPDPVKIKEYKAKAPKPAKEVTKEQPKEQDDKG